MRRRGRTRPPSELSMLIQDRLRQSLDYGPVIGIFTFV